MDSLIKKLAAAATLAVGHARSAAAQREEQVVGLRVRGIKPAAIGRLLGISTQAVYKIFERAIRSNVPEDLESFRRKVLAEFEFDENKSIKLWTRPTRETSKIKSHVCVCCLATRQ